MGHFTVIGNKADEVLKSAMDARLQIGIEKTKPFKTFHFQPFA
jgi:hypothetical protein